MNIIYKITYLPHLKNNTPPFYYIGSKYEYSKNYMGSPASSQKDWYTGELSIREWWKKETKKHPENFKFDVIECYENITTIQLVEEEKKVQLHLNVKESEDYFNKSIATSGWVSCPRTERTKNAVREKIKEYWSKSTNDVKKRKEKLIEYNKINSRENLLSTKLKHPEKFKMDETKKMLISEKVAKKWKEGYFDNRKSKAEKRVSCGKNVYASAKIAAKEFNVHPVTIRRKCKNKIDDWKYFD